MTRTTRRPKRTRDEQIATQRLIVVTHEPGPITENALYKGFIDAEGMFGTVYKGTSPAALLFGPPGYGKTQTARKVARLHGQTWAPVRPGSFSGLLDVLMRYRNGGVFGLDDIDALWDILPAVQLLLPTFDTDRSNRYISHLVHGPTRIPRTAIQAGVIGISNRNFHNAREFGVPASAIAAVVDRVKPMGLSFDPLSGYEYSCWLATERQMLRNVGIETPAGNRLVTLKMQNEVLEIFAEYGPRWLSVSPRTLVDLAKLRLEFPDRLLWLAQIEQRFVSTTPQWEFRTDPTHIIDRLHVYHIDGPTPAVKKPIIQPVIKNPKTPPPKPEPLPGGLVGEVLPPTWKTCERCGKNINLRLDGNIRRHTNTNGMLCLPKTAQCHRCKSEVGLTVTGLFVHHTPKFRTTVNTPCRGSGEAWKWTR